MGTLQTSAVVMTIQLTCTCAVVAAYAVSPARFSLVLSAGVCNRNLILLAWRVTSFLSGSPLVLQHLATIITTAFLITCVR